MKNFEIMNISIKVKLFCLKNFFFDVIWNQKMLFWKKILFWKKFKKNFFWKKYYFLKQKIFSKFIEKFFWKKNFKNLFYLWHLKVQVNKSLGA